MVFISDVIQKVEDMQKHRTVPSAEVLKFLSNINLDHILPSKPPIAVRRFMVLYSLSSVLKYERSLMVAVVGCFFSVAHVSDLGRNLYTRNDAPCDMERYQRPVVPREAYTNPTTTDNGNRYQRRWRLLEENF